MNFFKMTGYIGLCLIFALVMSGCNKRNEKAVQGISASVTPSATTIVSTQPATPELEAATTPNNESSNLLTFEVQPVTIPEGMEIPYMTKEEFPILDGSTANIPLGEKIYQYLTGASEEEAKEDLKFNKTPSAYRNLMEQRADILFIYEPSQIILQEMKAQNQEFEFKAIGRDALVFIANDTNPVVSLSKQQIDNIYTGKTTNWAEVKGDKVAIVPFQRPEESGSQTLMEKLAVSADRITQAPLTLQPQEMGDLIDAIAAYSNESNALGYSVYFYAKNMYTKPGLKFIAIDGVMPTNETIQKGDYPYVNDFYAVIRKDEPQGTKARILYDWMTTREAQQLVVEAGYVPIIDVKAKNDLDSSKSSVFKNGTVQMKDNEYVIVTDENKDGVFAGDTLVDRDLNVIYNFPGKRVYNQDKLVCKSSDIIMLKSVVAIKQEGEEDYRRYTYELYDLATKTYLTSKSYDSIKKTDEGLFICEDFNYYTGINCYDVYNDSGKLIYTKKYDSNKQRIAFSVVKKSILIVENRSMTVIKKDGTSIFTVDFPYTGDFMTYWNLKEEIMPNPAFFRAEEGIILIDENGKIVDDTIFLKNAKVQKSHQEIWMNNVGIGYDGKLIASGYLNGDYIIAKEDGTLLYEDTASKDDSYSMIYPGMIEVTNDTKNQRKFISLKGEIILSKKIDTDIFRTNGNIMVLGKNGFIAYNLYNGEKYHIKSDNYTTDLFVMSEGKTEPSFFWYSTLDKAGNEKVYSCYKDIAVFNGYAWANCNGENYYIVNQYDENKNFVMDTKGEKVYEAKGQEKILNVIEADELYFYVQVGNYVGIKDRDGAFVYRSYSPDLADD